MTQSPILPGTMVHGMKTEVLDVIHSIILGMNVWKKWFVTLLFNVNVNSTPGTENEYQDEWWNIVYKNI